jgi:hypothetical protein
LSNSRDHDHFINIIESQAQAIGLRVLSSIGEAILVRLMKDDLLFVDGLAPDALLSFPATRISPQT